MTQNGVMKILQYSKNGVMNTASIMLLQVSLPIVNVDSDLVSAMQRYRGKCLGLSAVQLGAPVRLIMVAFGDTYLFMLNPELVKVSAQTSLFPEGCLSVGQGKPRFTFPRPKRVKG